MPIPISNPLTRDPTSRADLYVQAGCSGLDLQDFLKSLHSHCPCRALANFILRQDNDIMFMSSRSDLCGGSGQLRPVPLPTAGRAQLPLQLPGGWLRGEALPFHRVSQPQGSPGRAVVSDRHHPLRFLLARPHFRPLACEP